MSHFEQTTGASDEWYTPPYIFNALGVSFDLDVAMPTPPLYWIPTVDFIQSDSLGQEWRGFVWCNPPFGGRNGIVPWLDKFFEHGNGICLTPDRTSTEWWQRAAREADATLFLAPKVKFVTRRGNKRDHPSNGTTLFAKSRRGVEALHRAEQNGLGLLMSKTTICEKDKTSGV